MMATTPELVKSLTGVDLAAVAQRLSGSEARREAPPRDAPRLPVGDGMAEPGAPDGSSDAA